MAANSVVKVEEFKSVLNDKTIRAQIRNSLKENSGAFLSSMIDLYSGDPYLQSCDPKAVAMECLKAASLKLPLVKSLGFAYVVPYKNVPTFTIGYKGLIQLAQRSGMYRNINADVVYEGEFVGQNKLSGDLDLSGEADLDEKGEKIVVGYFAYFKLLNGFEKTLYMSKEEVDAWGKKYSQAYRSGKGGTPWVKEFDKMAIKTVLRRLIGTYGVMSSEMQEVMVSESEETKIQKEIDANANKEAIDFDKVEYEVDSETDSGGPTEAEKQAILNAEKAEADVDYGQPSFI